MSYVLGNGSVQAQTNKDADLTAKKAGDLDLATVHIFTNDFTPTSQNVIGDYTEAAYAGYVPIALVGWTANQAQTDGTVTTTSTTVLSFSGPAAGGGPTAYGYFVKSAGVGTPLIYGERFDTPQSLASVANILNLVPTYRQK